MRSPFSLASLASTADTRDASASPRGKAVREQKKCTAMFSVTSFLSIPGHAETITAALDSFVKHNAHALDLIDEWILVDEFCKSDSPVADSSLRRLKRQFPQLTTITKAASRRGQAASLNIILDRLQAKNCTYWVHWEESWIVQRPFLRDAIALMDSGGLDQLQLTPDWHLPNNRRRKGYEIVPDTIGRRQWELLNVENWHWDFTRWPLYSLRPGIDRASSVLKAGRFRTEKELWPVIFEWDFGRQWVIHSDIKKAVVSHAAARRNENAHVSTYNMDLSLLCQEPAYPRYFVTYVGLSAIILAATISLYLIVQKRGAILPRA